MGLSIEESEAKIADDELHLPLARQFQAMKVDVTNFIPYTELVQEYSLTHNTDLTTAAFDIKKKLEAYRELEVINKEIKKAVAYWSALSKAVREDQQAITDLIYLRRAGCGKRDFKRLGEVIRGRRLDTDLIDPKLINGKNNLHNSFLAKQSHLQQQSGNSNLQEPNGHGPSMGYYIRLHLLKGATTNMLNRTAPRCN